MFPLKDDNPTSGKPIVTYFLIGLFPIASLYRQLGSLLMGYLADIYGWLNSEQLAGFRNMCIQLLWLIDLLILAFAIIAFMIFLFFFTLYNTGVFDRSI